MKESKNKEIIKYLLENYDIQNANDIADALKDMFKDTIQTMMNAEFDTTMGYEKNDKIIEKNNYRNGYSSKNVKSKFGEFELTVSRDRNSEFDPQIVPKNKRDISGIEEKVINLYAKGLSTRDISDSIEDIYGVQLSATMISNITDAVLDEIDKYDFTEEEKNMLRFIKSKNEEELIDMAEKSMTLNEAMEQLRIINADEKLRQMLFYAEVQRLDENTRKKYEKEREENIKRLENDTKRLEDDTRRLENNNKKLENDIECLKKDNKDQDSKIKTLINALHLNNSIEEISKITNLDIDYIKEVLNK